MYDDDEEDERPKQLHAFMPEVGRSPAASDTRPCPFCAETIKAAAIKCRFCGSVLAPLPQLVATPAPSGPAFVPAAAPIPSPMSSATRTSLVLFALAGILLISLVVYLVVKSKIQDARAPVRAPLIVANAPLTERDPRQQKASSREQADDAIAVLRQLYPIGIGVAQSGASALDKCHDESVGLPALEKCLPPIASVVVPLAQRMPEASVAKFACGREIEQAIRAFVIGQMNYEADFMKWVTANRTRLSKAMVGKSLPDGEGLDDIPPPDDRDEKYGAVHGASWARVMAVECTKTLFTCSVPDNVCWINKVADRLGLGSGNVNASDPLFLRGTTTRLN